MGRLFTDRLTKVWGLLVAVTLLSSQIGGPQAATSKGTAAMITVAVLCIAFAKFWMVMFTFMEVRGAPFALRMACTLWCVLVLSALLLVYFRLLP